MAKRVTRERMLYEGNLVTVLTKGRVNTTIRNAYGFEEKVKTRALETPPDPEDRQYSYVEGEGEITA